MSVFTYDPDPPRVSSPWLRPADPQTPSTAVDGITRNTSPGLLADYGFTKLEAEPQEGPTEYKLHLLLRPRRKYERISTASRISGSTQSRPPPDPRSSRASTPLTPGSSTTSIQIRQDRLEHLTTQLLWRLQQSCPYHAGSTAPGLVIPQLPDEAVPLDGPIKLEKLLAGLEASRGALYEIGVADDGTLAGLTRDEMDESLGTLRVMAASLGCEMKILREVVVGECEWIEPSTSDGNLSEMQEAGSRRHDKLWVAEALITPDLRPRDGAQDLTVSDPRAASRSNEALPEPKHGPLTTNQLRVTLTGPTTSGKSTLLGALSTGTLDNGRGTGRLCLLKHRHELASGVTSSVTQELVGYNDGDIINYAHGGVESWLDIHDFTKNGRLVYLVDSAGHPRYRRTILRGIVGWAPHWTILCIAADSAESTSAVGATSSAADILGPAGAAVDLASAHLDLCLRLGFPLIVVITKADLASRQGVGAALKKILTAIKKAGRTPQMMAGTPADHTDLGRISAANDGEANRVVGLMKHAENLRAIVPIMLTSAVDGRGIGLLHALLQSLPLPPTPTSHDYIGAALNPEQPICLFHIEDKFSLPAAYSLATGDSDQQTDTGTVVAGYLRFGSLSIGDKVVVGPFPSEDDDLRGSATPEEKTEVGSLETPVSHPSSAELSRVAARNAVSASAITGEWHTATIVSIRNLRLPVHTLTAGQAGSIGMVFDSQEQGDHAASTMAAKLRKGMVVAVPNQHMVASGHSLQAVSGLTAVFDDVEVASLAPGSLANIYVASVRAAVRVLKVSKIKSQNGRGPAMDETMDEMDDMFSLGEDMNGEAAGVDLETETGVEVRLELLSTREWVELGSQILLLEGGTKDRSGLEGFVGKVIEIVE